MAAATLIECAPPTTKSVVLSPTTEDYAASCTAQCLRGDAPDGAYLSIDVSSGHRRSGDYVLGERTGPWETWSSHPTTLEPVRVVLEHYAGGALHGDYRTWHPTGERLAEGQYVDGLADGDWRRHAQDGSVRFEGTFDRGTPIGLHIERYLNGQLATQRSYDVLGRPHGEWCFWLSDGSVIDCYPIESGNGVLKEYDESGRLASQVEVRDGAKHGLLVEEVFGVNRYEAMYREGQQHGAERLLRGDCVEREGHFVAGKEDGPYFEQACDVDPPLRTVEGRHCAGERCGRWTIRDRGTGRVRELAEYAPSGELLGQIVYDEQGEIEDFWGSASPAAP